VVSAYAHILTGSLPSLQQLVRTCRPRYDQSSFRFLLVLTWSQEKANLARIRDNQRRSRARRKEYLQELEARVRQCELHGIEASAELQMAARKVADENRKLRGLLSLHGIADDAVEAYLQASPTDDTSQLQSCSGGPVQNLHIMLQSRRKICSDGQAGVPAIEVGESDSGEGSLASSSTAQLPWDPNRASLSTALHNTDQPVSKQMLTPSSTTRSTTSSASHQSHHSIQHGQRLAAPIPLSRNSSPISMPNYSQMFDLEPQFSQPESYVTNQTLPHTQAHNLPRNTYIPTVTDDQNVVSLAYATDMISTMVGGDGNLMNADLGCMPGMDCEVDNQLDFNAMDRYLESTGHM